MSSGSESDDDYVPQENPENLSEEESADDETEQQYDNEVEQKNKRKATQETKGKKKRKTTSQEVEKPEERAPEQDPKEEKIKEDDLWAMFLDGTETKPKPKEPGKSIEPPKLIEDKNTAKKDAKKDEASEREKRIFEFAGETIVVENNVIKERIKNDEIPGTASKSISRASVGGLSGLLGQINKKNKLSTLEKSKLDWTTYKKVEGIEDEIQSHNKGKQGYLERRDFLERADYRQYEIERELRMNKRSNR